MTGTGRGWHAGRLRAGLLVGSLALALALVGAAAGEAAAETQDDGPCPPAVVGPAPLADRATVPAVHRYPVDCAFLHEIVQGFADDHFHPARSVRRDQMASFVARALDTAGVELPAAGAERFTDVEPGSHHDEAIHRLAAAAIVQGGPEGRAADAYGPALTVRRDQMASFLLRAVEFATGEELLADQTQRFADVPPGNAHFRTVNGAQEIGLVRGHPDGTYRPHADVRRDQMSTFVVRLLERLTGADPTTVWSDFALESEAIRSGTRFDTPAEALDDIAAHIAAGAADAEVTHRMSDWSDTHGIVELRDIPDDSVGGEDILVEFRSDAGGWHADPDAIARAHCRRGLSDTDASLCL